MFQGTWCRLSMFFSPAGRLAQSQLSGVCTILCMSMLGSFCCSQSHCLRQVLTEPGTYYFCYTGWKASEPHLSPSHSTESTDVHLLGFCSKRSVHWVNSPVSLPVSWRTHVYIIPQRLLLYSASGSQQCFFFFTVKHSSQPADPWEFPRLLTYKGQNYFCNNTKTLFSLVRWHLHWLSKWTDG